MLKQFQNSIPIIPLLTSKQQYLELVVPPKTILFTWPVPFLVQRLTSSDAFALGLRESDVKLAVNPFYPTYFIRCSFREICKACETGHVFGIHVSAIGILRHAGNMLNEPCSFTCGTTCVKNLNN